MTNHSESSTAHLVRRKFKPEASSPVETRKHGNPQAVRRQFTTPSSPPEPVLNTSLPEPVSSLALRSSRLSENMVEPMEVSKTLQEPADVPATKKAFVPLENNPEVMSHLLHQLGLSQSIAFHDVYSIDDPDLLAFVPRPAYALLLVFPVSETYEKFRQQEDEGRQEYDGSGPGEEVVWFKQTIRNACGLIGLLHGVSNGEAKNFIEPTSDLSNLLEFAISLKPVPRADLLYESQALESAHQSAASKGDTAAPSAETNVDLHYVCFVKSTNNHLWELDGRRKGPLDRGVLGQDEDVLSEKALALGVKSFLKREEEAGGGELRFSLVALGPSLE